MFIFDLVLGIFLKSLGFEDLVFFFQVEEGAGGDPDHQFII